MRHRAKSPFLRATREFKRNKLENVTSAIYFYNILEGSTLSVKLR